MSFAALHGALADLILGEGVDLDDDGAVDAWLQAASLATDDVAMLRDGGLRRLAVYRRLVRATLREAVAVSLERTVVRMGAPFDEHFAAFLRDRGPRTRHLRDVTTELIEFCEPRWRADPRIAAYLPDLARHENLQIEIAAMPPAPARPPPVELSLDARLAFTEASRVVRYAHAVHLLSDDPRDRAAPPARPTALFAYRSPTHEVRYLELTPVAAALLERLLHGELPLGRAVLEAAAACGTEPTPAVLDGTARLLADLCDRGAVTGTAALPRHEVPR